ncbi:hypothetical protein VNO77_23472 [Canavalia gladiata]|uniref:Uncharacterized protein n=1 Tax=Canavalia gladiata TaxID=3824 RepID=A0AAN9L6Y9_CANGL
MCWQRLYRARMPYLHLYEDPKQDRIIHWCLNTSGPCLNQIDGYLMLGIHEHDTNRAYGNDMNLVLFNCECRWYPSLLLEQASCESISVIDPSGEERKKIQKSAAREGSWTP